MASFHPRYAKNHLPRRQVREEPDEGLSWFRQTILRYRIQQRSLQQCKLRSPTSRSRTYIGKLWNKHTRLRYSWQHGKWSLRLRCRIRIRNVLWKHNSRTIRSSGTRSMGPSAKVTMYLARSIREISHVSSLPRWYARRRASRFCRWQRWLLDADTSWKRSMGFRSFWAGENWPDYDNGPSDQGWRLQIRYVGQELYGSWWKESTDTTRRSKGLYYQTKVDVTFYEN